jgi:uncharacterized protein
MTGNAARVILTRWEIRRPDGPPIRGDLRVREGESPTSAVVVCHGFKGFKDWAFFPVLARELSLRGHAAVSFNFSRSGVGDDGVDFSALERFAEQTHSRNVAEIGAVLKALRAGELFPAGPAAVGLFGHSRGGGEAVLAASDDPGVAALVTWSAISRVERWSPDQVAAWERGERVVIPNARTGQEMPIDASYWRDLSENRERLDILAAAARIPCPWLLVHGEADETVPLEEAHALFDAASGRADLLLVADAGHTFGAAHPCNGGSEQLDAALQATLGWFDLHLRRGR